MYDLLPAQVTNVQVSFPGLPALNSGTLAIGKDKTGVLDLYSDTHYLEVSIPQNNPAAWDALRTFIDDFNLGNGGSRVAKGVEMTLDIGFSANRTNGELHCEYNSSSFESNFKIGLKAKGALLPGDIVNMAKINLKNEVSNSAKSQGVVCKGDASSSEQFNSFAFSVVSALIGDDTFAPKMSQAQQGLAGLPPQVGGGFAPLPPLPPFGGGTVPLPPCVNAAGDPISEEQFRTLHLNDGQGTTCQDLDGMSDKDKKISLNALMSKVSVSAKKKVDLVWNAMATDETFTTSVLLKGNLENPWDVPARVASTPEYKDSIVPYRTGVQMGAGQWVIIKPLTRYYSVYDYAAPVTQRYLTESEIGQLAGRVQFGPSVAKSKSTDIVPLPLPHYEKNTEFDETTYPTYPFDPSQSRLDLVAGQGRVAFKMFTRDPVVKTLPIKLQPEDRACGRDPRRFDFECQPSRIFGFWNGGPATIGAPNTYDARKTQDAGGARGLDVGFLKEKQLSTREWIPAMIAKGAGGDPRYEAYPVRTGDGWGIKLVAKADLGELILYNTDEHDCVHMDGGTEKPGHCVKNWRERVFMEHQGARAFGFGPRIPWAMNCDIFKRVQSPYVVGCPPLSGRDYTNYEEGWLASYRDDRFKEYLEASSSVIVTKIDVKEDSARDPIAFVPEVQTTTSVTAPLPSGEIKTETVPAAVVVLPTDPNAPPLIPPANTTPPKPPTRK
jgi:hypothetical protein